jgi:serine/threonine protein kinase
VERALGCYLCRQLFRADIFCFADSLQITVYELIHGRRPFKQWKPTDTVDPVSTMRFGSNVSSACQDFIRGLLVINPAKRLGCGKTGWAEVKEHAWFNGLDWDAIKSRSMKAPISPDQDAANCSNSADLADQLLDVQPVAIPQEDQRHFAGFEFRTDYQEFLAAEQREKNLAGLNMSTATDVGPLTSHTNASHQNASHAHSHMIDSEPVAGAPHPQGSKANSTAPSPVLKAVGSSTLTVQPMQTRPAAAGGAAASSNIEGAGAPIPSASLTGASNSSEKYIVASSPPPVENHSIAGSPSGSTPAGPSSPPVKQPTSARRKTGTGTGANEIPFTRNQIALTPAAAATTASA